MTRQTSFTQRSFEEIYVNGYYSPRELRQALEWYVTEYNTIRPHEALNYKTPDEVYAACFQTTA